MNALLKLIFCLLVIVVGFLATLILAQPLTGMRGAPWFNFYVFEMVLVWGLVALVCACVLIQTVSENVGVSIGNWIRGGGFWAVLGKSNIPGNTWVVIALILLWNAITYGPPTPKVDWDKFQYQASEAVQETVSQPETQNVVSGAKGTINYLAKGFLGQEVIGQVPNQPQDKVELLPRYQKGWWRIWVAVFVALLASMVWVWGRRDDLHEKVSAFADRFREKPKTSGSATSSSGSSGGDGLLNKLISQTDAGDQITNHIIGDFLTRAFETILSALGKMMKKY